MRLHVDGAAQLAFARLGSIAERVIVSNATDTMDPVTNVVTRKETTHSVKMIRAPYTLEERGMEGVEVADTRGYFLMPTGAGMSPGDEVERPPGRGHPEREVYDVVNAIEYPGGIVEAQLRKAG